MYGVSVTIRGVLMVPSKKPGTMELCTRCGHARVCHQGYHRTTCKYCDCTGYEW